MKLKAVAYQSYMSSEDWVRVFGKAYSDGSISEDDCMYACDIVEDYLKKGKPSNFNYQSCLNGFRKHKKEDEDKRKDKESLYVTNEETGTEQENPEIYKNRPLDTPEETVLDKMCIASAFQELKTINKEIMVKYQVNLIKLIQRCIDFPNEYGEEFRTLKTIIKELDQIQQEQIVIILSSKRAFCEAISEN